MRKTAKKRGVHLTSVSRPLKPQDFRDFQYIVGMDPKNMDAMQVRPAHCLVQGKVVVQHGAKQSRLQLACMQTRCCWFHACPVPSPLHEEVWS